ncbi:MAG: hypothetical protein ABSA93_02840 [Streptosporangiaceae bacterium]
MAAAAVTAIVIPSGPTASTGSAATTGLTARQILLAAATTAATVRADTYWHFEITMGSAKSSPGASVVDTYQTWIAHDGVLEQRAGLRRTDRNRGLRGAGTGWVLAPAGIR